MTLLALMLGVSCRPQPQGDSATCPEQDSQATPGDTARADETGDSGHDTGPEETGTDTADTADSGAPTAPRPLRVVVIGDYGMGAEDEAAVAELVRSLEPDAILTTGDNNYPDGEAATIDQNVGRYYSDWIHPYLGSYGTGAETNAFWPTLGNHDWWSADGAQPYLDYFELPGNERYYTIDLGPLEVFALSSDDREPDGNSSTSFQAGWFSAVLAASEAPFKVAVFHNPPYSSGEHGGNSSLRWGFLGCDLVLSGHDHNYERAVVDGLTYVVEGRGGADLRGMGMRVDGSQVVDGGTYGATLLQVTPELLVATVYTVDGDVLDQFQLLPGVRAPEPLSLIEPGSAWRYLDSGVDPGESWVDLDFDDSGWSTGEGQFGYGDDDETTVVASGGDPEDRHITTWFRRSFEVDATVQRAVARLLRDDGAVVWLNGEVLDRQNMPGGDITSQTLATRQVEGGQESTWYDIEIDPALFVAGTNLLAVEVHQEAANSDDLSFDLQLQAWTGTSLIALGADWRYLPAEEAPADWAAADLDDSGWSEGPAPLGFGQTGEATMLSAADGTATVVRFRRAFDVEEALGAVWLSLVRDDGAVVYLDGEEVLRFNLPLEGDGAASTALENPWKGETTSTLLDGSLFGPGTHELAVSIHQSEGSDDLRFDLELVGL